MDQNETLEVFKTFDKNNDGFIDKQELKEALQMLKIEEDPEESDKLFEQVDKNGDNKINFTEFCLFVHQI